MAEQMPTLEEWRHLYAAAVRLKEVAPWEWMEELDVFGVQNPETDEIGFASVMGSAGEHYAVGLYLGAEGLYGLWQFEEIAFEAPERYFEIPQIQASFENRSELDKQDLETIKALGLKFRGRQAWPMFRSYRPGYAPWVLTGAEARFLTAALGQVVDVALRLKEDYSLLDPPDDESYLVRVPGQEDSTVWEDRWVAVPPPPVTSILISVDPQLLESLAGLPQGHLTVEVDLVLAPGVIQAKKEDRPILAYILLAVDTETGYILGVEPMQAIPSPDAMWAQIPASVTRMIVEAGVCPSRFAVRSQVVEALLKPLADWAGIQVVASQSLNQLEVAKAALFEGIF